MPGCGFVPKAPSQRRRRAAPIRGEWQAATAVGWQHGRIPAPPRGLTEAAWAAWRTWFRAWFASQWAPADLPGLRKVIQLYDATERGEFRFRGELRLWEDTYGITPKGQQDRRWLPPEPTAPLGASRGDHYPHLRVVSEPENLHPDHPEGV
jgi:hypothetical protein